MFLSLIGIIAQKHHLFLPSLFIPFCVFFLKAPNSVPLVSVSLATGNCLK